MYYRPRVRFDQPRPSQALPVAGGPGWFTEALCHSRDGRVTSVGLDDIPDDWRDRISAPRLSISGITFDQPRVMGIVNVTPDSFSDGGQFSSAARAVAHGQKLARDGADILDIGGESTRPGAKTVPVTAEIARTQPVIRALSALNSVPISVDTRKSAVGQAALEVGAAIVNDVSGFTYDPMLAHLCAREHAPICIMHALGDPETMQEDPQYDDVLLDVYDFLAAQIILLEELGIARNRMIVDPGIGFGKKIPHNLALLNGISLFHGLGCPILLGASRKGFIGRLAGGAPAAERMPGSVAVALAAAAQGVQILRVHDVAATRQALTLWQAVQKGTSDAA